MTDRKDLEGIGITIRQDEGKGNWNVQWKPSKPTEVLLDIMIVVDSDQAIQHQTCTKTQSAFETYLKARIRSFAFVTIY